MSEDDSAHAPTRRLALIDLALAATATGVGGMAAYPVARYLNPPRDPGSLGRAAVAKARDLPPNTSRLVRLGEEPVLVVAGPDGELKAFSARCPHMGCVVAYARQRGEVVCNCHAGRFSLDGRVLGGPPPAPLREVPVEVVGEDVIVGRG